MPEHPPQQPQSTGHLTDLTVDEELLADYDGAVPRHVAAIMDGNGRWARHRGKPRLAGHRAGAHAVRRVVESCRYLGVDALTLYAFSTQNWNRPASEVSGLMTLFNVYIERERERLIRNGVQIKVIGQRQRLAAELREAITALEKTSSSNSDMLLQVAVSYGGRQELVDAARALAEEVRAGKLRPDNITEARLEEHLYTKGVPDPDLVIRTSGELRISNFLLWQIAYSEFYVTDVLWPDFDEHQLLSAFESFGDRQRRFGQTGGQIDSADTDGSTGD